MFVLIWFWSRTLNQEAFFNFAYSRSLVCALFEFLSLIVSVIYSNMYGSVVFAATVMLEPVVRGVTGQKEQDLVQDPRRQGGMLNKPC